MNQAEERAFILVKLRELAESVGFDEPIEVEQNLGDVIGRMTKCILCLIAEEESAPDE